MPYERNDENIALVLLHPHPRIEAPGVITNASAAPHKPWYSILYLQVLIAIFVGIAVGHFSPKTGLALKPLGDAFVALIRMMIAPVIFCVVVQGIASMTDLKKVGRVGIKALLYFEVVSTLALIVGILVGVVLHPGTGLNVNLASLDPKTAAGYVSRVRETGIIPFLLAIIPRTFVDAFATGDVLQVLLVSTLSGFAICRFRCDPHYCPRGTAWCSWWHGFHRSKLRGRLAFESPQANRHVLRHQLHFHHFRFRHDRISRRLLHLPFHSLH